MILHVDLDAFYASVEQRDDPSLRGRPVLVGGRGARSVVAAASYEARAFGCRSAMPMGEARRRCPQAVVIPPRMDAYARDSAAFREILLGYTPLVEPLSIDEAFCDVSGSSALFGPPRAIAERVRADVRARLALTCSVGIAPVKFAAKIATDLCKPDGLREVAPDELVAFLAPLPIERLFGVGPKTARRLHALGLSTLSQIAAYPTDALVARIGDEALHLQALALGVDPRRVEPERAARSIGAEETFERDLVDGPELRRAILRQADRVATRLRAQHLVAEVVVLKLKDPAFQIRTRRRTLPAPTSDGRVLAAQALELLDEAGVGPPGVRLSGVAAHGLRAASQPRQLELSRAPARGDRLMSAIDSIRERFGDAAIDRAALLRDDDE